MNKHLHKIINRGVKEEDPIEVRRQIGLLNTATLCCLVTLFFFMVLNTYYHNWLLLANNAVLLLLTTCLLYIYKLTFFNTSIIILCLVFSVYFFADALLFHNALQYAIIVMMVVSILLIHSNAWCIIVLCIQVALFMAYTMMEKRPPIIAPLPVYRNYVVTLSMLVILALMLLYFKRKHVQYIKHLGKLNSELLDSNRVKQRMLSVLSHDFNAPVANLSSMLTLVEAKMLTPLQFDEFSGRLKAQLNVLNNSITDVLQWSKMEMSGKAEAPSIINIRDMIDELLPLFEYALQDKRLQAENTVTGEVVAVADSNHLKLIFRNLLSNAIKFSHPGKAIIIGADVREGLAYIYIRDEGTGMKPAVLASLRQQNAPFNTSAGTLNEKGTGIGLLLVQEFLQKNNGRLMIDSTFGKGSTFTIVLPAGRTE